MSKIRLHGSSSGYTEIAPVAASGNNTLTLPNDGTIISKDAAGAVGVTSVHTTNITATGIATITTAKIGAGVTISESGIEASGIGITCKNINGGSIGGRRNMFINGSCVIGQRGSTASLQSGYGGVDRYYFYNGGDGRVTFSQDTDVPTGSGFSHSIKLDVTTADSNGASNRGWFGQRVERDICQRMKKGTSSATKSTVSFWIKSPKTGTHIVRIYDNVNDRDIGATYTVSSANTWEHKVVTFPADTTGAISNGTTYGMQVYWLIVSGSNTQTSALGTTWATYVGGAEGQGGQNLLDSTDNNIYFTGLQWEVGDEATEFEHRSTGEELSLCQRYYYRWTAGSTNRYAWMGQSFGSGACFGIVRTLPVTMRAVPTSSVSGTYTPYGADGSTSGHSAFSSTNMDQNNTDHLGTGGWGGASGISAGDAVVVLAAEAAAYIDASAEI